MGSIILKEELDKFEFNGEVRGTTLKAYGEYIYKEKGETGLKKLEDTMADLGYPIDYRELKMMNFYPLVLQAVTIEVIKRIFGYDAVKFQELGKFSAKFSFLLRLFMKYFFSASEVIKRIPQMWRRFYTVGELKVAEYNEEKRYVILRLENFRVHPLQCQVFIGYLSVLAQMIRGSEIMGEETKCTFRGDEFHEFVLRW